MRLSVWKGKWGRGGGRNKRAIPCRMYVCVCVCVTSCSSQCFPHSPQNVDKQPKPRGRFCKLQQHCDHLVRGVMAATLCSCLSAEETVLGGSANCDNTATNHLHRLSSCTGIKAGWKSRVGVEAVGAVYVLGREGGVSTIEGLPGRWTGAAGATSMWRHEGEIISTTADCSCVRGQQISTVNPETRLEYFQNKSVTRAVAYVDENDMMGVVCDCQVVAAL